MIALRSCASRITEFRHGLQKPRYVRLLVESNIEVNSGFLSWAPTCGRLSADLAGSARPLPELRIAAGSDVRRFREALETSAEPYQLPWISPSGLVKPGTPCLPRNALKRGPTSHAKASHAQALRRSAVG
jgi:hypothetical protein